MNIKKDLRDATYPGFIGGAIGSLTIATCFVGTCLDVIDSNSDKVILAIFSPVILGAVGFIGGAGYNIYNDYYYGEDAI